MKEWVMTFTGEMRGVIPLPHHNAQPVPMAVGKRLSVAPESDELRMVIETDHGLRFIKCQI